MIKLILEITEANGIGVELKSEAKEPTKQEELFAKQFAKTISDFLDNAPRGEKPSFPHPVDPL